MTPDLIYIIGSGRSGSTVIERVLNSAPDVLAVGEVHALWRLPIETLLCSCGERVPDCAFWQQALDRAGLGAPELAQLKALEAQVVRNSYLAWLRYDLKRIRLDQRLARFIELNGRLLAGLRATSGCRIVLDSSKAGPRGWVLAAGLNPLILHSYRGAQDVMTSWRRPKFEPSTGKPMKKPPLTEAAVDWIKAEQAARSLARKTGAVRLRYTEFAQAPRVALGAALSPALPGLVDRIDWTGPASVRPSAMYHSVLGNPDRFDSGDICIQPQRADIRKLSLAERIGIRLTGRALQRLYP